MPLATDGPTFATRVKTALPPGARAPAVQVTVPPDPTAGVVHVQPATAGSETKVVPAGRVSARRAAAALLGPALVTVMV